MFMLARFIYYLLCLLCRRIIVQILFEHEVQGSASSRTKCAH